MPIYAYKCESCGHTKDVLQKMSDAPLTDCPQCGAVAFKKQLTAAGFQLKGSGWYVTDFRGGPQAAAPAGQGAESAASGDAAPASKSGDAAAAAPSGTTAAPSSTAAPAAAPAKTTAPAPASSTGSSVKSSS